MYRRAMLKLFDMSIECEIIAIGIPRKWIINNKKKNIAGMPTSKNAINIQNKTIYRGKQNNRKFSWKTACSYLTEQMKDNTKEVTFNLQTMLSPPNQQKEIMRQLVNRNSRHSIYHCETNCDPATKDDRPALKNPIVSYTLH